MGGKASTQSTAGINEKKEKAGGRIPQTTDIMLRPSRFCRAGRVWFCESRGLLNTAVSCSHHPNLPNASTLSSLAPQINAEVLGLVVTP